MKSDLEKSIRNGQTEICPVKVGFENGGRGDRCEGWKEGRMEGWNSPYELDCALAGLEDRIGPIATQGFILC